MTAKIIPFPLYRRICRAKFGQVMPKLPRYSGAWGCMDDLPDVVWTTEFRKEIWRHIFGAIAPVRGAAVPCDIETSERV